MNQQQAIHSTLSAKCNTTVNSNQVFPHKALHCTCTDSVPCSPKKRKHPATNPYAQITRSSSTHAVWPLSLPTAARQVHSLCQIAFSQQFQPLTALVASHCGFHTLLCSVAGASHSCGADACRPCCPGAHAQQNVCGFRALNKLPVTKSLKASCQHVHLHTRMCVWLQEQHVRMWPPVQPQLRPAQLQQSMKHHVTLSHPLQYLTHPAASHAPCSNPDSVQGVTAHAPLKRNDTTPSCSSFHFHCCCLSCLRSASAFFTLASSCQLLSCSSRFATCSFSRLARMAL